MLSVIITTKVNLFWLHYDMYNAQEAVENNTIYIKSKC